MILIINVVGNCQKFKNAEACYHMKNSLKILEICLPTSKLYKINVHSFLIILTEDKQ